MQRLGHAIEALAALADHAKALQLSTYPEVNQPHCAGWLGIGGVCA